MCVWEGSFRQEPQLRLAHSTNVSNLYFSFSFFSFFHKSFCNIYQNHFHPHSNYKLPDTGGVWMCRFGISINASISNPTLTVFSTLPLDEFEAIYPYQKISLFFHLFSYYQISFLSTEHKTFSSVLFNM